MREIFDSLKGGVGGVHRLTANELGVSQDAFGIMGNNIRNNAVDALVKSFGVNIGFRVGKKALAPARRMLNKGFKIANVNSLVRV